MNALEVFAGAVVANDGGVPEEVLDKMRKHLDELTAERNAHEGTIKAARDNYCSDDIEIDDLPTLSIGDEGVWVSAWVWVPIETEENDDEN